MNMIDTSSCESEPIRFPGTIQPHGALLVLQAESGVIEAASESCEALLGLSAESLLGQPARNYFGADAAFLTAACDRQQPVVQLLLKQRVLTARSSLNAAGQILVDIERDTANAVVDSEIISRSRCDVEALRRLSDVTEITRKAAERVKEMTGFDRVMFYRFDAEWNGEVIAEACSESIEPYLGIHFPASDIPEQARELFQSGKVRQIPDVLYQPSALHSRLDSQSIDLGFSSLRSVSPQHIEYLNNMKVRATLVGALMVEGRLWGLLSCQHKSEPKYCSPLLRDRLGWFCLDIAALIETTLLRQRLENRTKQATLRSRLVNRVREVDIRALIQQGIDSDLLKVVAADGFALVVNDNLLTTGMTPAAARIRQLLQCRKMVPEHTTLYASSAIDRDLCPGNERDGIAGALFVSVQQIPDITLIWFRRERELTLRWGGDPNNAHCRDESGRLSPRKSFADFITHVRGQCCNWSVEELESAAELGTLIEIEEQRREQAFAQTILNSMPVSIAVLDEEGFITSVNEAWGRFANANGYQQHDYVGLSYCSICAQADGTPDAAEAALACAGISAVLNRQRDHFTCEYSCDSPGERRWFCMNVYPMLAPNRGVVVVHENISDRKRTEAALAEINEQLEERVIERTEQLRQLAMQTTLAEQHERQAIARDLHDDLGQRLHIAKIKFDGLVKSFLGDLPPQMQELNLLLADASRLVRSLTSQLSPPALSSLGLGAALRWLCDELEHTFGLVVEVRSQAMPVALSEMESVILYRAARELLINVAKHAESDTAKVELYAQGDMLLLSVEDEGIGIESLDSIFSSNKSFGLSSVRERITYLGGSLELLSKTEGGIIATLKMPFTATTTMKAIQ